jgi:hypothetical protein
MGAFEQELAMWQADHPGKPAEDFERVFTCGATKAGIKAMRAWRVRRGIKQG